MTTLLRSQPPVHSNPRPARPGPALKAVGLAAGYPPVNLVDAAEHYSRCGSTAGCEAVDPADVALLDGACDHDCDWGCPGEPRLPLADWIEVQAAWFRSQETATAAWLASEIQELADLARALHAATTEQFDDRRQALEQSMRESSFEAFLAR